MTPADTYREKAAAFDALARYETNPTLKTELWSLAASYRRLAEQADQNATTDMTYETPRVPQMQQQQQVQPKERDEA